MLPQEAYDSARYFRRERDQLFRTTGLALGPLTLPDTPGAWQAIDLFDEPCLLMRDKEKSVGLYSRLCRHQFAEIVRTDGQGEQIICPLHGWVYGADGRFKGLAGRAQEETDRPDCDLRVYDLEQRDGLLYAGMDPLESRDGWQPLRPEESRFRPQGNRTVSLNWKQIVERALSAEGTLKTLNLVLFDDRIALTIFPKFPGSSLVAVATDGEQVETDFLNPLFSPRATPLDTDRLGDFHAQVRMD